MSLSLVQSRALVGLQAIAVTVEVHLANGLPSFTLVSGRRGSDTQRRALKQSSLPIGMETPKSLSSTECRGQLVVVCGIDGAGKSSLVSEIEHRFAGRLQVLKKETKRALSCFLSLEELQGQQENWSTGSFVGCVAALSALDFLQHYQDRILPLLDAGATVVCDRYSYCYQAYLEVVSAWPGSAALFANIRKPDLAILVDVPVDIAVRRQIGRGGPSADEDPTVLEALRRAYLRIAEEDGSRWRVLDNSRPIADTHPKVFDWLGRWLKENENVC